MSVTAVATVKPQSIWLTFLAVLMLFYFIPTVVCVDRKKHLYFICFINFLLGWTGIGWILTLVMAYFMETDLQSKASCGVFHRI